MSPSPYSSAHRRPELLQAGLGDADLRRSVRRGEATRLTRGIYAPGTIEGLTTSSRALGILEAVTADASHAASHRTAAELLQLPLSSESARLLNVSPGSPELTLPLEVTTIDGRQAMRRRDILLGHRSHIAQERLIRRHGILVTDHARTWADMAPLLPLDELVALADQLIRIPRPRFESRSEPLSSLEQLAAAVEERSPGRGVARARQALALSRIGADSPAETHLRLAIGRAGLPEPEVNAWIRDADDRPLLQPDLSFRQWRVAVQYEGAHHSDPRQVESDVERAELTELLRWVEVRLTRRHMLDGWAPGIDKIRRALLRNGWRP